jgi:hypothetical protein
MLVTKADFARVSGVSRQAVHKALKSGDLFHAETDGKIDTEHPAARKWLLDHDVDPAHVRLGLHKPREKATAARRQPAQEDVPDVSELVDQSLRWVTDTYGSNEAFAEWLDRRKTIGEIHRLELANAEKEGRLIPRDGVQAFVMAAIDATFRRLLRDFPKTVAQLAYSEARAGASLEETEAKIRDAVASQLRPMKLKVARSLRGE